MSSSLPLTFPLPLSHRPQPLLDLNLTPFLISKVPPSRSPSKPHICFSISPSSSSNYEKEEARWLREEQRWLREEQRWLREESRWNAERESLIHEISALRLRIQELENRSSLQGATVAESVANIAALLQVLKKEVDLGTTNWIAETGSSAVPIVLEATAAAAAVESRKAEDVVKEVLGVSKGEENGGKDVMQKKKRETLRKGSEGEDVRVMQEALQRLGFYSGEEDMEYSSFSSGTERAVKTWQASLGTREDGIMTSELQERLFMEQQTKVSGYVLKTDPKGNNLTPLKKEGTNGAAVASAMEITEIQQMVVKEEGVAEVEISQQRVFLLGENRWEEPSRLTGRNKQVGGAKSKDLTTRCLQCRGEGRLLCTECDGTGEPNVEPQFLDWVGEGAKCPYCDGDGYTICDVCEGKMTV